MNNKELFTNDVLILNATLDQVWNMLVNPTKTSEYMFGCEIVSDFGIGDDVLWKSKEDGIVYVVGSLKEFVINTSFVYTVFSPTAKYPNIPENHLTVSCQLKEIETGVELTITQGDFNSVFDGQNRYKEVIEGEGWSAILGQMKVVAEE